MQDKFEQHIVRTKARLLEGMVEFMEPDPEDEDDEEEYDCGYTQSEIDRCEQILDKYLQDVASAADNETRITQAVEHAVEELNRLNEDCEGTLIETDQREEICEILLSAARHYGLKTQADITEPWRQW